MDANDRTNVAVLGSGGREHAMAWKLAQSPLVGTVYVLPGNLGMTALEGPSRIGRKIRPMPIPALYAPSIVDFCQRWGVSLVVPGPDRALVSGTAEDIAKAGIPVFGPSARAAMLTEGSKCDAKNFMERRKIPTAPFRCFEPGDELEARVFISDHPLPVVVKDNGLADGKGVAIALTHELALHAATDLLANSHRIVVEEYLPGTELSFTCLVVGNDFLPLALSRDHKTLGGKMTGGMGAVSSDDLITADVYQQIINTIVKPTVAGLVEEDASFTGFLYLGLMIVDGVAYVLEYNCRLGDPEAQAILARLDSDFYITLREVLAGKLTALRLEWNPHPSVCIVLAADGYPGPPRTGDRIRGLNAAARSGVRLFSAGISEDAAGELITAAGRVLNVVAVKPTMGRARRAAYAAAAKIRWPGKQMVKTIGEGL
ncbi:MAG: phosphoribosylamine--glycine ligase [bacterium]|nr:phosphoribosylamine--glycine ligase [bacterium]